MYIYIYIDIFWTDMLSPKLGDLVLLLRHCVFSWCSQISTAYDVSSTFLMQE